MSQDDDHKHTFKPVKGKTLTKRNKCAFQINSTAFRISEVDYFQYLF